MTAVTTRGFRCGDRWIHEDHFGRRSQTQPATRFRDAPAPHGPVLDRRGSRARSPSRSALRTSTSRVTTSSDGRTLAASIARRRGPSPTAARCRCGCSSTAPRSPLPADQSRRVLADLQRPRDRRREAPVQRLAGFWLLHILESRWTAGIQRDNCRRPPGQHRGAPPGASPRTHYIRARSERSHERARPAAKRPAAHVPGHGQRRRATDRLRVRRQLQVFSGKPWAATTRSRCRRTAAAHSARAARLAPAVVAVAARSSAVEGAPIGGMGRVELLVDLLNVLNDTAEEGVATDNLFSSNFGQPTVFMDPRRAMLGVRLNLGR